LKDKIDTALTHLTDNERTAISLVFLQDFTQDEAAGEMRITQQAVSKLCASALEKLKSGPHADTLLRCMEELNELEWEAQDAAYSVALGDPGADRRKLGGEYRE